MKKLFEEIRAALARGENTVLCTVLASSGSAPRGAGARMAVFADGHASGTIGGGAVERIAAEQALELLRTGENLLRTFRLSRNQICDIGMICGGDVTVYYQILKPEALPFADALLEMLGSGENGWLLMKMDANASVRMGLYDERHGVRFLSGISMEALRPMLLARAVYREGEESWYVEPVSRAGRVYIFGGGHVGRALVPVLAGVEFRVTVFDNRPDFAKQEAYPDADCVILGNYQDIREKVCIGPEDYVVIMTPGHQADRAVLLQAMRTGRPISAASGAGRRSLRRTPS